MVKIERFATASDPAKAYPDYILQDFPDRLVVQGLESFSERLRQLNVFSGPHERLAPDDKLIYYIPKDIEIEEYARISGETFFSCGALSYGPSDEPRISMGRYCSVAERLRVMGDRHPMEWFSTSSAWFDIGADADKPHFREFWKAQQVDIGSVAPPWPEGTNAGKPKLEHDVWIGQDVTLAQGITIGTGAVVGAGSVVTKSVPPYAVVAGNPARLIRYRFDEATIERLLASQWWDYLIMLDRDVARTPQNMLDNLEREIAAGTAKKLNLRRWMWRDFTG